VIKVADRYGNLHPEPTADGNTVTAGVSLKAWHDETERLRILREAWSLVRNPKRRRDRLAACVNWRREVVTLSDPVHPQAKIVEALPAEVVTYINPKRDNGSNVEAVYWLVCKKISEQLTRHVHLQVKPFDDPTLYYVPDCLLGVAYMAFLVEIRAYRTGSSKFYGGRLCDECGNPIEEVARKGQRFCTPACRSTYHNARRTKGENTNGRTKIKPTGEGSPSGDAVGRMV
jgi:hypothetical protein